MLLKFCPRCNKLIEQGKQYCDTCQVIMNERIEECKKKSKAKADKKYNKFKRDPKYVAFYKSNEWKTLRAVKLSQVGYVCEECKRKGIIRLAVDVHHKTPISVDWDKRLDIDNLECLCVEHHNERHKRFGNKKTGVCRKV